MIFLTSQRQMHILNDLLNMHANAWDKIRIGSREEPTLNTISQINDCSEFYKMKRKL